MKYTPLFLCLLCAGSNASLFGQCFDDNLRGSYGYLATLGAGAVTTPPTGTTPPTFSNTPIGTLLGGISGANSIASSSTLYFDGLGRVFAANSSSRFPQSITSQIVGSYAVGSDCTVQVSLYDAFTDSASPTAATNPSLVGLVARGGDEVYLAQKAPVATGSTAPTGNAALLQRTVVRLSRFSDTYNTGCTVSTLRGRYALIGDGWSKASTSTGTGTTPPATVTPYYSSFLATVDFDGTGNLNTPQATASSNLGTFQYRGTYTMNSDCSGTLSITQQPAPVEGATNPTPVTFSTVRFVVTPQSGFVDANGQVVSQAVQNLKPGFSFSITNADQTVSGFGVPQ